MRLRLDASGAEKFVRRRRHWALLCGPSTSPLDAEFRHAALSAVPQFTFPEVGSAVCFKRNGSSLYPKPRSRVSNKRWRGP